IEQDRLLRQPGERGGGGNGKLHINRRLRCERAVDLFRRGGGDDEPRAGFDGHVERETVAACDAAGCVDDDGFELARCRPWTPRATRAALAPAAPPPSPGAGAHRKRDAAPGGFRRNRTSHIGYRVSHVSAPVVIASLIPAGCALQCRPPRNRARRAKKGGSPQMAIARLSAASSIVSRLQE